MCMQHELMSTEASSIFHSSCHFVFIILLIAITLTYLVRFVYIPNLTTTQSNLLCKRVNCTRTWPKRTRIVEH